MPGKIPCGPPQTLRLYSYVRRLDFRSSTERRPEGHKKSTEKMGILFPKLIIGGQGRKKEIQPVTQIPKKPLKMRLP